MKVINPKQNFEIIFQNILTSDVLTNSNQKVLLLILLSNHKKFNTRHYSFTLSDEICTMLNVTNPTFRKERDILEKLNLIIIKTKKHGVLKIEQIANRKHSNLYYYFNWQRLNELGFIEVKKSFNDIFEIGHKLVFQDISKIKDEVYYKFTSQSLDNTGQEIGTATKNVRIGKELKINLKVMNNDFKRIKREDTICYYQGVYKEGESYLM